MDIPFDNVEDKGEEILTPASPEFWMMDIPLPLNSNFQLIMACNGGAGAHHVYFNNQW